MKLISLLLLIQKKKMGSINDYFFKKVLKLFHSFTSYSGIYELHKDTLISINCSRKKHGIFILLGSMPFPIRLSFVSVLQAVNTLLAKIFFGNYIIFHSR